MIKKVEITSMPASGEYDEVVYDIQNSWNSQYYAWIKFQDDEYNEWYGSFRGRGLGVGISFKYKSVIVLTSDYFFELDYETGNLKSYIDSDNYNQLTVTPQGDFLASDCYRIEKFINLDSDWKLISTPLEMDMVKFLEWNGNDLSISFDEFLNWDNHCIMIYNSLTEECSIKNCT